MDVHLEVACSGDPGVKYKMLLIKTLEMYCSPRYDGIMGISCSQHLNLASASSYFKTDQESELGGSCSGDLCRRPQSQIHHVAV